MSRYWALALFFFSGSSLAQEAPRLITLVEVIKIAREQSPAAQVATHTLRNRYWQYRTFRANYLPSLNLDATIPDFNQSFSLITNDDGTETFQKTRQVNSDLGLSLNQEVGVSGGRIFLRSDLLQTQNLSANSVSYLSNPIVVGFSQPLFQFNPYRWLKVIEPKRYEEARREYVEATEQVAIDAVGFFFGLYASQINLLMAQRNHANNDTIYRMSQGRYNLGKIAENELLQMELSFLNSNIQLAEAKLDVEVKQFDLGNFLAMSDTEFEVIPPNNIPPLQVNVTKALELARASRKKVVELERRLVEARREIARARAGRSLNMNIVGSYGLNKVDGFLEEVYKPEFDDRQRISLGIEIPILDWGKGKGQVKTARSGYDLIQTIVEQESIQFDQEIFLKVRRFNIQSEQLRIAAKADTIGQKRYFVSKQRYFIGKIGITDLNIALQEKDRARRDHSAALRRYWQAYYEIRKLTFYDFEADRPILMPEEDFR